MERLADWRLRVLDDAYPCGDLYGQYRRIINLMTDVMLDQIRALKQVGPVLQLEIIERVIAQNHDWTDKLPRVAGLNADAWNGGERESVGSGAVFGAATRAADAASQARLQEANRSGTPVSSPALDKLIKRALHGGR